MHIITFKEDDIVNINDVIHDGHYCVSQKASLCTEAGRVSVLVKSCHRMYNLNAIIIHIIYYSLLCCMFCFEHISWNTLAK